MGILDRLKPALPEVPVGPEHTEQVHVRVRQMDGGEGVEEVCAALESSIREDLMPVGRGFSEAAGLDEEELVTELLLHAQVGFLLAVESHEAPRARSLGLLEPYAAELREYVALGCRPRFDEGPGALLGVAEKIAVGGRDPRHVVLGMLPMRLGLAWRRGGSEGLIRLAVLAQMAGYGAGEVAWKRREPDALR